MAQQIGMAALEESMTKVIIGGVEYPDFGFRSFVAHFNDYDLFRLFRPCYLVSSEAQIVAQENGTLARLLTPMERLAMGVD